ncbi:DUF4030 domain-containing protein [Halobacillus litoralis]|uniref:DUF4030 domain-containing protein n=1 Tax=Halobacillus litoralis TaxID=45668 RepID=A0A845E557_9BACI|nr:DUF4030 domain-containing protein [Halobacillus litoralis]MYL49972.1 DUF4030 domain-containing protein [Halobacillus litoralis]
MSNRWKYPEKVKQMKLEEEHQKKVLERLQSPEDRRKSKARRFWMGAAVVVLLLGGLLFTPAMEHVVAKIPYISQFIEQEEDRMVRMETFFNEANQSIEKEGYRIGNMQVSKEDKEVIVELIEIEVGKRKIQTIVEDHLEDNGFHNYEVSVKPFEERVYQSDVTEEEMEQFHKNTKELEGKLTARLQEENFELMFPVQVQMNPTQGVYINVIVPETETRLSLLEDIMLEEGQEYNEEPKLDIRQVEKKAREQEKRWEETGAVNDIAQAMMESEQYPVTGFAYSFHPYPLQIKIKTSLDRSNENSKEIAEEIREEIDLFIQTGDKTAPIRGDEYEVYVLSKDKKNIQ